MSCTLYLYIIALSPATHIGRNFCFFLQGSSDSIHNFFLLSVLKLVFNKNYFCAGILLGLSIHLRQDICMYCAQNPHSAGYDLLVYS